MLVNFVTEKLWQASSVPDNDVHDALNNYPNVGDLLYDSVNNITYICEQTGASNQIWSQTATIPAVNSLIAAALTTSGNPSFIKNKPTIPAAQIQSDWTQGNTGLLDYIKNKPAARSQSSASRSLNSAFQVSATRDAMVNYSVDIATAISLTTGQSGTVVLEIASDSGFTTNVQELGRLTNSQTGTLTLGLALNQTVTANVGGYVPPAYYVRLRTVNNTGTPTFTYRSGQELLM